MDDFIFDLDMGDFSDFDIDIDIEFDSRYIKPPKTKEIASHNLKYDNAVKLAKDINIKKGSRFDVILNGSFIFGDFLEAFIMEKNYHVKEMTISTLSLSENNVDSLGNLMYGQYIDKLNVIVSDYFFSHERDNLVRYMYEELDKDDKEFQLAAAGTHCKITLIETHCGNKFVFHGSANLRSSANIEQVCFEENKTLFDFHNEYNQRIIEKYKTINKSIRVGKLWKLIN